MNKELSEEAIKEYREKFGKTTLLKPHEEFMEDVDHFTSLPTQTCRALAPESDEDKAMYLNDGVQKGDE